MNATFTGTANAQLEVGQLEETITVSGESPVVDVKSNVQQTVMSQELLEGLPTGRDVWSVRWKGDVRYYFANESTT